MKRSGWLVLLVAAAMVVGLSLLMPAPPAVQGAPAALLTPAVSEAQSGLAPRLVTLFSGSASIAADTRGACFETLGARYLDIHYGIDQGTTNTTTLTLQHAIDTSISYETLDTVVSANAADADALVTSMLWGRTV